MIQFMQKIWIVDKGNMFDMPKVRSGVVSETLTGKRFLISLEDGTERVCPESEIFTSCRTAHNHQVDVLSKRLSFIRPRMEHMEQLLANMTA